MPIESKRFQIWITKDSSFCSTCRLVDCPLFWRHESPIIIPLITSWISLGILILAHCSWVRRFREDLQVGSVELAAMEEWSLPREQTGEPESEDFLNLIRKDYSSFLCFGKTFHFPRNFTLSLRKIRILPRRGFNRTKEAWSRFKDTEGIIKMFLIILQIFNIMKKMAPKIKASNRLHMKYKNQGN